MCELDRPGGSAYVPLERLRPTRPAPGEEAVRVEVRRRRRGHFVHRPVCRTVRAQLTTRYCRIASVICSGIHSKIRRAEGPRSLCSERLFDKIRPCARRVLADVRASPCSRPWEILWHQKSSAERSNGSAEPFSRRLVTGTRSGLGQ